MYGFAGRSRPAILWLGALALTVALGLAACGGGTTGQTSTAQTPTPTATPTTAVQPTATPTASLPANTVQVRVANFLFSPSTLTIKAGMTVLWTNTTAGTDHTVTGDTGNPAEVDGAVGAGGGTFSFTFTVPGTYHYHCSIHPIMKGTITVTP